jgi:hypothetical protein
MPLFAAHFANFIAALSVRRPLRAGRITVCQAGVCAHLVQSHAEAGQAHSKRGFHTSAIKGKI